MSSERASSVAVSGSAAANAASVGAATSAAGPPVHVESVGAGPPLVLLHGFALHGGLFAPIVPALARRHRVLVVDLPGHGRSAPVSPFDLATLVSTIAGALADVSAPLTLLGWSLGGQVALQWALAHPARVRRLMLVASTPSFVTRPGWPQAMSTDTLARFGDELRVAYRLTLQRFLTLQVQGSAEGRRTLGQLRGRLMEHGEPSPSALRDALRLVCESDLRPVLGNVTTPALVIGGTCDALVPLAATQALAAALPRGVHRAIDGAAHVPFLSHSAEFLDALNGFADA